MQRTEAAGGIETMESASLEREGPRPESPDGAARRRAAVETYSRHEAALRRTARRYSLCEDDAEDALQRGLEILLRKAPSGDPRELIRWTQTVVKHEALAIRGDRERTLPPPTGGAGGAAEDWLELLPSAADGPAERAERREAVARSREALRALKPQELRALSLLAQGYSYAEIGEITSWSQTKINRCLAEGRERFRRLISSSEDGRRCAEMQPLISAFCDGEAGGEETARLREHLRACAHCRATLRAYRAAPGAAAALAPLLPLHRSLWERACDAAARVAERFGGRGSGPVGGVGGGAGAATLAKVAIVCVGGAAAGCVAGGLVPSPSGSGVDSVRPARLERQAPAPVRAPAAADREPRPAKPAPRHPKPDPKPAVADPAPEPTPPATESIPEVSKPAAPVEFPPPPEPAPVPEPAPAPEPVAGGGSAAGEFGP
jgi:RNA polymerase sigma factor (sigma-70 family)